MPTCIYCRLDKTKTGFSKSEHVLPQAFGRFRENLTLWQIVCDACNERFGNTIDLYLARDTPDGLNRFLLGFKPSDEYKSLGKASTLTHRLGPEAGWLKGAFVEHSPSGGITNMRLLPQFGFGLSHEGPFEWMLQSALSLRENEIRKLVEAGRRNVTAVGIENVERAKEELRRLSLGYQDKHGSPLALPEKTQLLPIETTAILTGSFGRAIAKIGMNYLASQYGPAVALMAQFDVVRSCIYTETTLPLGSWVAGPEPLLPKVPGGSGHVLAITWDTATRSVNAHLSFHQWGHYRVTLASGGFIVVPSRDSAHFYNLKTMAVELVPLRELVSCVDHV